MQRFIIEREIPGASTLTEDDLARIATTSNEAVASLGVPYNWVNSYVAGDKVYCVHEADDAVARHAHRDGGQPMSPACRTRAARKAVSSSGDVVLRGDRSPAIRS